MTKIILSLALSLATVSVLSFGNLGCMRAQAQSSGEDVYEETGLPTEYSQVSPDELETFAQQKSEQEVQPQGDVELSAIEAEARACSVRSVSAEIRDVCLKVNHERASRRLPLLQIDLKLTRAAQKFAVDMKKRGYFSHESPEGVTMKDRLKAEGAQFGWVGENIARGQDGPSEVMSDWMKSKGHRSNILHPKYKKIGIGYFGGVWVQEFSD